MIKVYKRGTNAKQDFKNGIKSATLQLRMCLAASILVNIVLSYCIYKG